MHKVCALVLVVDQWSPANILICWYYHRYCISAWASMLSDIRQCVNFLESFWCRMIPRVIYTYQMFTDTISANKVIFKLFPALVTDRCHKCLTSSRIIAKTVCKWTDLLISNIFVGRCWLAVITDGVGASIIKPWPAHHWILLYLLQCSSSPPILYTPFRFTVRWPHTVLTLNLTNIMLLTYWLGVGFSELSGLVYLTLLTHF